MTLDHAELLAITESSLRSGSALCSLAGQVMAACENQPMIVVVAASPDDQQAMEREAAKLNGTGDLDHRAALTTLAARENAQRLAGLLTMLGVEARLLDPVVYAPITRGSPLEAEPRLLHARRYEDASRKARALILAGGVGRSTDGRLTSLGTGGAALSGLFIAQRLGVPVKLVVGAGPDGRSPELELPRRADLFARRYGVSYDLIPRIARVVAEEPTATVCD